MLKVAELMNFEVQVVGAEEPLRVAARMLDECKLGALPVCKEGRLVGIVTDRDITAASLMPPDTRVAEVMNRHPDCCRDDEDGAEVLRRMGEAWMRRMPVVDGDGMLVGVVALGERGTRPPSPVSDAARHGTAAPHEAGDRVHV